jgi:IS30 family transposase
MLLKLQNGTAEEVCRAMTKKIMTLRAELPHSVTWDQGNEMALYREFTVATGVRVYFCDPQSPWQRGSNENTNGYCGSISPKELTSRFTHKRSSIVLLVSSTNDLERRVAG